MTEFAGVDVSRETMERLEGYEALLLKWNKAINLVSPNTLSDVRNRHFADSAQAFEVLRPQAGKWVDLGSGGGFPGLIVAILAAELSPALDVVLVESDRRKAEFLRTVGRELGLNISVICDRIEGLEPLQADYISARALAPLHALCGFADLHLKPSGKAVFLKGANFREELHEALEKWSFSKEEYLSKTNQEAAILCLGDIRRV